MNSIRDCFVTGKWEEDKDAAKLLAEDGKSCILQRRLPSLYLIFFHIFNSQVEILVNCEMLWASPLLGSAWMHIVSKVEEESLMPSGIPPC